MLFIFGLYFLKNQKRWQTKDLKLNPGYSGGQKYSTTNRHAKMMRTRLQKHHCADAPVWQMVIRSPGSLNGQMLWKTGACNQQSYYNNKGEIIPAAMIVVVLGQKNSPNAHGSNWSWEAVLRSWIITTFIPWSNATCLYYFSFTHR